MRSKAVAALLLLSMTAQADCDFSTGIEKLPDGRYAYSAECHRRVGRTVLDLKDREEQVAQLTKTVEMKDLGVKLQEERAQRWMDASFKLEDRVNQMDAMRSTNQWLYFGIGVLSTSLAVWGAGQLGRR